MRLHPAAVLVILALLAVPHAAASEPGTGSVPGSIVIRIADGTADGDLAAGQAAAAVNATGTENLSAAGLPGFRVLSVPAGMSPEEAAAAVSRVPGVAYAEQDYYVRVDTRPDDPLFPREWGLRNTGQGAGTPGADINVTGAWNTVTGSRQTVIAIVDTGVDFRHPDLADNIWTNPGETGGDAMGRDRRANGIDDDGNGYVDDWRGWDFRNNDNNPMDDYGHGTHCAGVAAAAGNNGIGISGVNWKARIMPLKFIGSDGFGTEVNAAKAIRYAERMGADVISCSWGGSASNQVLENAINSTTVPVVCSAGNDRVDIESSPHYPASYPARQVIAVAGTNNQDSLASWSNYGAVSVDVAAPGNSIYSTYTGGGYVYMTGTSMAVPFVSGLAGLITAKNPHLSAKKIKALILNNVKVRPTLVGKTVTGGRIDAFRSVRKTPAPVTH